MNSTQFKNQLSSIQLRWTESSYPELNCSELTRTELYEIFGWRFNTFYRLCFGIKMNKPRVENIDRSMWSTTSSKLPGCVLVG